jgi:hypothetical protein
MKRRAFIGSAGAGLLAACQGKRQTTPVPGTAKIRLAGMTLAELRKRYHNDLFDVMLPF